MRDNDDRCNNTQDDNKNELVDLIMEFLNKDLPPLPKECIEAIQKIEKWYDELEVDYE